MNKMQKYDDRPVALGDGGVNGQPNASDAADAYSTPNGHTARLATAAASARSDVEGKGRRLDGTPQ